LLVAIAAIVGGIGFTYRAQKKALLSQAPHAPQPLPDDLKSASSGFYWTETDAKNHKTVEIRAAGAREQKDSSRVDLTDVELKLHNKNGLTYDLVRSAAASYYKTEHRLYSEGDVEITLNIPEQGEPKHKLVTVKSSGVTFDTNNQRADTDRVSTFTFERGDGAATGAYYDAANHELVLKKDVILNRQPENAKQKPMHIEASSLAYHEAASEVWLKPWGKLSRGDTIVEGEQVVVHLKDKEVSSIEAVNARGSEKQPTRNLEYSAKALWVNYNDDGAVEKITAQDQAHLVSTSTTAQTEVNADHVELNFNGEDDGTLQHVTANGHGVVTSKPVPAPGRQPAETHVLRSETFELKMRPGGREIESVVTHAPGNLEFLPNIPTQHHRTLDGNNMVIAYGPQNRIESFRATDVRTRTDPTEDERKRNRTVAVTASREMLARFEPNASRLASMEQWGDFTYDEGDRKARAAKATLDQGQDAMVLEAAAGASARVWDPTGSTAADRIRMNQRTGDFTAEGRVQTSRLPEKDQKKNSDMLSGDEPLEAQAAKMVSTNRNRSVHYEGAVAMRQGANRINADVVDLDREKRTLTADGTVVTRLWDEKSKPPVLTVTTAPHLVYTDQDRQAVYTGGVTLTRGPLRVKGATLRAFLAQSGSDSRLEKAFADGSVEIVQSLKGVVRNGTGNHAEYYTEESKILLNGGRPKMVETVNGKLKDSTEGEELTYFPDDGRLLVNGSPKQPAQTHLQRKK
jgi:lipopolysaccharide export system protein LptA